LVSDSSELQKRAVPVLESTGAVISVVASLEDFWFQVGHETFDLLFVRRSLLPRDAGEFFERLRGVAEAPEVIVMSDRESPEEHAGLQVAGSIAVLSETLDDDTLAEAIAALVRRRRQRAVDRLRAAEGGRRSELSDFSARSQPMRDLLRLARKVVAADTSLLLLGETGVGKEWLARAIHSEGPRAGAPFLAVNCAAVPETLLESELFGHEKGSFTGAIRARRGYFELAHGGTLFLDEIGDLPFHLQVKLLRALQERTVLRIGSERSLPVDVRVMAATNRNLEDAIAEGSFRKDLFYRLSVMTLLVPPLRQRREDIVPLVETYFEHFRNQLGRRDILGLSEEALLALEEYPWPGNVRELINVLERAVLLCEGEVVTLDDLPASVTVARRPLEPNAAGEGAFIGLDFQSSVEQPLAEARAEIVRWFEKKYLQDLLRRTRGNVGATAEMAGIDPRTLYNKMRLYGLRKEAFRDEQSSMR
jgi:DNA-binding NtrC family response regulator